MDRPELGQRLTVHAVAHPVGKDSRKWESFSCDPFDGVYVGTRFKRNGYTAFDDEWDAPYFVCEGTVEVWLVAANPFHEPRCVFPADCDLDDEDLWAPFGWLPG